MIIINIMIAAYSLVAVNLTLLYRMLQSESPLRFSTSLLKDYEFPFGASLWQIKHGFLAVVLYSGFPMSTLNRWSAPLYIIYWFLVVLWFKYLGQCLFVYCLRTSLATLALLVLCWHTIPFFPLIWWACYTAYISHWFVSSVNNGPELSSPQLEV